MKSSDIIMGAGYWKAHFNWLGICLWVVLSSLNYLRTGQLVYKVVDAQLFRFQVGIRARQKDHADADQLSVIRWSDQRGNKVADVQGCLLSGGNGEGGMTWRMDCAVQEFTNVHRVEPGPSVLHLDMPAFGLARSGDIVDEIQQPTTSVHLPLTWTR